MLLLVLACGSGTTHGTPPAVQPPAKTPEPPVKEAPPATETPLTKATDLEGRDGQRVVLHGTYQLMDVRQRKRPPPQYRGHAGVQLEGIRIFLEPIWAPEAIRSTDEQTLNGKKVEVVGTYHLKPPESPEGAAQLMVSVLRPVESVKALD